MAVSLAGKQASFLSRFDSQLVTLMQTADTLAALQAEFTNNLYGSTNAFTDAIVQASLPAVTAAQLTTAISSLVAIQSAISNGRQALEAMRP